MKAATTIGAFLLVVSQSLSSVGWAAQAEVPSQDTHLAQLQAKAEAGDSQAQFDLGAKYFDGDESSLGKDPAQGILWLRRSAAQGNPAGQTGMGLAYRSGSGVSKDPVEAVTWFRKAALQGHGPAQRLLGFAYQRGEGVKQNASESFEWFKKAAASGDTQGMTALASVFYLGEVTPRDMSAAIGWYRSAANNGSQQAMSILGGIYEFDKDVPRDYGAAADWYRQASDAGNLDSRVSLARLYRDGQGVHKDEDEAFRLFMSAANAGNVNAWPFLGWMYQRGLGTKPMPQDAVYFYRKAAQAGNAMGLYYLGLAYAEGELLPADDAKAANLILQAAEKDLADAQYWMGERFAEWTPNVFTAARSTYWLASAARQGHQRSAARLLELRPKFLPFQATMRTGSVLKNAPDSAANDIGTLPVNERVWVVDEVPGKWTKVFDEDGHLSGFVPGEAVTMPVKQKESALVEPFPAIPDKVPGVVSCNTKCLNGDCFRTYESGRTMRFQAKSRYNAIEDQWEWDPGPC